ncbi:MAG: universal stress protein, partial [Victivallales bacterium]|nr:universal stress protein [Victivallales bacterium]
MGILEFFNKKNEYDVVAPTRVEPTKSAAELLPFPKKIMIVVDGSQASYDATSFAIAMASRIPDCKLCAAFVVDTANMDILLQMHIFVSEERASFEGEMETKGRRTLDFVRAQGLKNNI